MKSKNEDQIIFDFFNLCNVDTTSQGFSRGTWASAKRSEMRRWCLPTLAFLSFRKQRMAKAPGFASTLWMTLQHMWKIPMA